MPRNVSAKARFYEIAYSPDGSQLAVAGSIGQSGFYDAHTGEELNLFTGAYGYCRQACRF